MRHPSIVALFGAIAAVVGGNTLADGNIVVAAQETAVTVRPQPARLHLVNLPPLEFALRDAIECKGKPVSVTLSVADAYRTIHSDDLDGARAAEAALRVPPRQLALAASSRFCVVDDPESSDELLVTGFATVHASLRCESEDEVSAHFASAPLRVRLSCEREPEETQESSDASGPR